MGKRVLYKNKEYEFTPYSTEDYKNICLTIGDIKKALNLDFSSYKKDGAIKKCTNENVSGTQNNDFDISDVLNLHNEPMQEPQITQQQADQITELQAQLKEKDKRIAELESEKQNLKKTELLEENYNPTERETHLQIIAMQSFELAKLKSSYLTGTGKVRQSTIATVLEKEAKELFANPKSSDTYRKRIAEALKTYETQAE